MAVTDKEFEDLKDRVVKAETALATMKTQLITARDEVVELKAKMSEAALDIRAFKDNVVEFRNNAIEFQDKVKNILRKLEVTNCDLEKVRRIAKGRKITAFRQ